MSQRKKYSKEFKLDAISLVVEQGYSRPEAAKSLGISPQILGRWINEHKDDDGLAFRLYSQLKSCHCLKMVLSV